MPQKADGTETGPDQMRLQPNIFRKPPVSAEDLKTDTEYDPEGAEEFLSLIRTLRKEGSRPVTP